MQVLIEAGSASSFELSPHFANQMSHQVRGSREQVHNDVELELQEAMSENVLGEESLLDGEHLDLLHLVSVCLCYFLTGLCPTVRWLVNVPSPPGTTTVKLYYITNSHSKECFIMAGPVNSHKCLLVQRTLTYLVKGSVSLGRSSV